MQKVEIDRNIIETLFKRIAALEARVKALEENSTPTIPIYDNTNMPLNAVEGQIAIAPS